MNETTSEEHPLYGIIWGRWIEAEVNRSGDFTLDDYQKGIRDGIRQTLRYAGAIARHYGNAALSDDEVSAAIEENRG